MLPADPPNEKFEVDVCEPVPPICVTLPEPKGLPELKENRLELPDPAVPPGSTEEELVVCWGSLTLKGLAKFVLTGKPSAEPRPPVVSALSCALSGVGCGRLWARLGSRLFDLEFFSVVTPRLNAPGISVETCGFPLRPGIENEVVPKGEGLVDATEDGDDSLETSPPLDKFRGLNNSRKMA